MDRAQGYRGPLWRAQKPSELKTLGTRLAARKLAKGMMWDLSGLKTEVLATQKAFDEAIVPVKPGPKIRVGVRLVELNVDPKTKKKTKSVGESALRALILAAATPA